MTRKIFWQDPYLTTLEARVAHVDGAQVLLDQTILFAFSGGQESDAGTIGGYPVLQAAKRGLEIVYTLPAGHALQAGDAVTTRIDWERRYRLMRLHFAAEMVLQLIYRHCPGILRTGAHIAPAKARIDFTHEQSLAPQLAGIAREAQAWIDGDHPIVTAFSDLAAERRYWEVDGFARMACGGTHPRTTGEVGGLALKRKNPGRNSERVEIMLA
ncbi:alanyl-tRNA editing protein [Achromobacter sp. UMC71]|uniref:alanyl-tRNA editing protein n=1 Tax=Achromobacter sp. UMC71 TaxID=1862320 RepID=UPI001603F653|nr:alanyl-tRNA editing protein [Achromobacter sp. UMC71]MBB1624332.1 alanyl-tRNA editing protein [Achromobacter sp. UMC71]